MHRIGFRRLAAQTAIAAVAGMAIVAGSQGSDGFIGRAILGAGSGAATGGLASHSLVGRYDDGTFQGSSGRCYAWTPSGRMVTVLCPRPFP
jgi:hypothetical protein